MEIAKINIIGTSVVVSDLKTITSGMVGATVSIEYDSTWDGLNKQVVFKTAFQTFSAEDNTIPHELLKISDTVLRVGVYGYTDDGTIVIPTVYADLGRILQGADPIGETPAKPTPPVWNRLQIQIDELGSSVESARTAADNAAGKAEEASTKAAAALGQAETASECAAEAAINAESASEKVDALDLRIDQLEATVNNGLTDLDTMIGGE